MKPLLAILILPLMGCVQGTTVWEGGQRVLATNGDYAVLQFRTPAGTSLSAVTATHSSLITARGKALEGVIEKSGVAVEKGASTFVKGGLR